MSYRSKTYTWNDVILVKRSMIRVFFFLIIFIAVIVTGLHFVLQNGQPVKNSTGSDLVNVEATDPPPPSHPLIRKSLNDAYSRLRCPKFVCDCNISAEILGARRNTGPTIHLSLSTRHTKRDVVMASRRLTLDFVQIFTCYCDSSRIPQGKRLVLTTDGSISPSYTA
jgi:hypothetical protein